MPSIYRFADEPHLLHVLYTLLIENLVEYLIPSKP